MVTEYVIETEGLTKRYKGRTAVNDLSMSVPVGVVAGFVGPNGAGKTTTMSMLLGLIKPTAGGGCVLGKSVKDPDAYLKNVGALIEQPAFYPGLSGTDNLRVLASVAGHSPDSIPQLLDLVGLEGRGEDRFGSYSMGMKQRLGIAAALLGDPALLILDEPTNGLDPAGIREMRELITRLADGGRTIFVSSHALSELEQVCDYFVVIEQGSMLFQGAASELLAGTFQGFFVATECPEDMEKLERALKACGVVSDLNNGSLFVEKNGVEPRAQAAAINRIAFDNGLVLAELTEKRMTLEGRYLEMVTGGSR
jgi:ABC-2 type transport system ATP-binding protein